jgi:hypothetical protein
LNGDFFGQTVNDTSVIGGDFARDPLAFAARGPTAAPTNCSG